MKTLSCFCHSCGMEYEIKYNENEFIDPDFCAGCGIGDGSLEVTVLDN